MTSFKFARFTLPALTAAVIALGAQAAFAQTTPAPTSQGSMSGMNMAAPAPAKTTHHVTAHALPASEKFTSLSAAQAHCASDVVVWANTGHSKLFHLTSSKYFGKTKHGSYVCQKSALAAGYHAAKN
jgi:hypothetical protein